MTPQELKAFRTELGLTQKQMAELIPVPLITYKQWEQGKFKTPGYFWRVTRDIERQLKNNKELKKSLDGLI